MKQVSSIVFKYKVLENLSYMKGLICLTLLCTSVYIYLYSNLVFDTKSISVIKDSVLDYLKPKQQPIEMILRHPENLVENENVSFTKTKNLLDMDYNETDFSYLLVLFTTFSSHFEKYQCRNNTIKNWSSFAPDVKLVFFSDDIDLIKLIQKEKWSVLPPHKSSIGIPVLKHMYLDVMKKYNSYFYAYANGDILFTPNLVDTLRYVLNSKTFDHNRPMLIVGQRTNVKDVTEKQASTFENIYNMAGQCELFSPAGADYFITNKIYPWEDFPDVVIGRVAYDNWLVLNARKHQHTTIDATKTIFALHQTTKAGNAEGHHQSNRDYNKELLGKLYHIKDYAAGMTSCTTLYTSYNVTNLQIELRKRTLHNRCTYFGLLKSLINLVLFSDRHSL